jgi:hypothetical protein
LAGGIEINGTYHLLVCADNVSLLIVNVNITKKNTEIILDASREVDLQVNTEKIKNLFMYYHQVVGENRNINVANKLFKVVAKFIRF